MNTQFSCPNRLIHEEFRPKTTTLSIKRTLQGKGQEKQFTFLTFSLNDSTVVSALAHAPRELRKPCAIAKRALKPTFFIVKIDLVIASQRAVMRTVR